MKLILGSSSPRRSQILRTIYHNDFAIAHPDIDESPLPAEKPEDHCLRLAAAKAENCKSMLTEEAIVICADTIVTLNDSIYGKPRNRTEAVQFLTELEGRSHFVLTGFALCTLPPSPRLMTGLCRTEVTFKPLTRIMIDQYLDSIGYLDKAGAYAIQENGARIINKIDGSLSNVVGFPVSLFFSLLLEADLIEYLYR